jgi:hypothetical protein
MCVGGQSRDPTESVKSWFAFLIPSCQFVDSRLGRKNRRVAGGDASACLSNCLVGRNGISMLLGTCLCFIYYSLRVIPQQFPEADCPFQIVNDSYWEFIGHVGWSVCACKHYGLIDTHVSEIILRECSESPKELCEAQSERPNNPVQRSDDDLLFPTFQL